LWGSLELDCGNKKNVLDSFESQFVSIFGKWVGNKTKLKVFIISRSVMHPTLSKVFEDI
jgi:hypothetical protein